MPQSNSKMFGIGVADIVIGAMLVLFGSICLGACWVSGFYTYSGGPVWTGILAIIAGVIGVYASKTDKVNSMSVAFLVLNIFVIICTVYVVIGAIVGTIAELWWLWFGLPSGFVVQILITMTGLALMIVACIGACNHCVGGETRTQVVMVNHNVQQPGVQVIQQHGYTTTNAYYGQQPQPVTYMTAGTGQVVLPNTMSYNQPMPPNYSAPQQAPPYSQQVPPYSQPMAAGYSQEPPPAGQGMPPPAGQGMPPPQPSDKFPVPPENV
ncbi:uncharacterized protein LOC100373176 [Saccoglossus kowalevskii]|uniref:Uncharacterized protein LOC100373176 n=1 Tax=Saccoglossus kowalevskii TaxID=10224 RepID=A0ABM0GSJ6_SACKO|nr:PREDICTED: uncharacterized protein LOC100373176 [Saccoglossus kowalevskii]